jgi:hypothetical protein
VKTHGGQTACRAKGKESSFTNFLYVCPEPVLANDRFSQQVNTGVVVTKISTEKDVNRFSHTLLKSISTVPSSLLSGPIVKNLPAQNTFLFECFPYVCPEPVLVK